MFWQVKPVICIFSPPNICLSGSQRLISTTKFWVGLAEPRKIDDFQSPTAILKILSVNSFSRYLKLAFQEKISQMKMKIVWNKILPRTSYQTLTYAYLWKSKQSGRIFFYGRKCSIKTFNVIYLARESETGCYTAHCGRNKMVQVAISRGSQFQSSEADVIESFVVDAVCFIGVFNKLVNREGSVVRFDDGVWHFWGWHHAKSVHNTVGVFLTDLWNQQSAHSRACSTAEGVCELKSLQAVTALRFLSDNI